MNFQLDNNSFYTISSNFIHSSPEIPSTEFSIYTDLGIVRKINYTIKDLNFKHKYSTINLNDFLRYIKTRIKKESLTHQLGFLEVIEQLYGISFESSKNHKFIKMVISEFDRIKNHSIWMVDLLKNSGLNHLANQIKGFNKNLEPILKETTGISGKNLDSCLKIGKIIHTWNSDTSTSNIDLLELKMLEFDELRLKIINNKVLQNLLISIGIMTTNSALKSGSVGPIARSSGLDIDLRVQDPYWEYPSIKSFKISVSYDQDLYGNLKVILSEIRQSLEIIKFCLTNINDFHEETFLEDEIVQQSGHLSSRIETASGPSMYRIWCDENMKIKAFGLSGPSLTNINSLIIRLNGQPVKYCPRIIHAYNLTFFSFVSN